MLQELNTPGFPARDSRPLMTIPLWSLLAFAAWTLVLLMATVGVYRWSRILTGRAAPRDFRADQVEGLDWYKRAMRAHLNCIENLPVFGTIVLALTAADIRSHIASFLCVVIVVARAAQSLTHVGFAQTNPVVAVRSSFFFVQVASFLWLMAIIVLTAW